MYSCAVVRTAAITALGFSIEPAALERLLALLHRSFQPATEEARDRLFLLDATATSLKRALVGTPELRAVAEAGVDKLSAQAIAGLFERGVIGRSPAIRAAAQRVLAWKPADLEEAYEVREAHRNANAVLKLGE